MKLFPSNIIVYQQITDADHEINDLSQSLGHKSLNNNPDIFSINQETGWTIELIRYLKNFIAQKPFNHQNKIIIISEAHNLNIESQNALLKTLEEPGDNNYIFLTTNRPSKLLNTITSRCHTIRTNNFSKNTFLNKKIEITGDFTKDTLVLEKFYKNKDQILPLLKEQLYLFQQDMVNKPNSQKSRIVKKIIKSINMIEANVDPKSALDFIFL